MVQIIRVQGAQQPRQQSNGLGDALAALGDALVSKTPEAQRDLLKHKAAEAERINRGQQTFANSFKDYDAVPLGDRMAAAIEGGIDPKAVAGYEMNRKASSGVGVDSGQYDGHVVAAGRGVGDTAFGVKLNDTTTRRGQDVQAETSRDVARIGADRQAQSDRYKHDNTPVAVQGPDGRTGYSTQAAIGREVQSGDGFTPKVSPILSSDQVRAGVFTRILSPELGGRGQPSTGAESVIAKLPSFVRKEFGAYFEPKPYFNPQTGSVVTSRDGGDTYEEGSRTEPLRGTGFIPMGEQTAAADARMARAQRQAQQPPPMLDVDPRQGEVGAAAYKGSGADAFIADDLNAFLGSLGITKGITKLGLGPSLGMGEGAGEVGPEYQRARERLAIFRQTVKAAFINSPTFPLKEQRMVDDILPSDRLLTNPESERQKVGTLGQHLRDDNARLRQEIVNAVTPDEVERFRRALSENERALRTLTNRAPNPAATPSAQPQRTGPKPGDIEDDYQFVGGDPASPNSWRKVQ